MNLYENNLYMEDVKYTADLSLPWGKLSGKTILISGVTGLIGSFLADVLLYRNRAYDAGITILGLCRDTNAAAERFQKPSPPPSPSGEGGAFSAGRGSEGGAFGAAASLHLLSHDINTPLSQDILGHADFVLHLASNTHPVQYATDPIGTITSNILGLMNMLEYACDCSSERVLFASSNEIYGENRGDVELFDEHYCGYIDSNTLRAGYPESKRCGEALVQAYIKQKGTDAVIARLTRSYGPTMKMTDTKAISQFIRKGIAGEDIVLKSAGEQFYSYTYVSDAVAGLLTVLLAGECGVAYNISDEASDIKLKDLAALIAGCAGKKVVFDLPDATEAAGFSKATKARLDGSRLKALGFAPRYDIRTGTERTITILR